MTAPRTNLVIVRAGASSLHGGWLQPAASVDFDVLVTAYEDLAPIADDPNVSYLSLPGRKVAGYARLFKEHPDLLDRYRYIALLDDDIETNAEDISELFRIGDNNRLDVWQPSLTWNSYYSYACVLRHPGFAVRYTNYVEMMCPFFSARHLREILPLFNLGYETGIDTVWCRFFDAPWFRSAIIDTVSVRHTKPVGMQKHLQGFDGKGYDPVIREVTKLFGTSFRGGIPYAAIDVDGRFIASRLKIAVRSWLILKSLRATPMAKKIAIWYITSSIRHTLLRRFDLKRPVSTPP